MYNALWIFRYGFSSNGSNPIYSIRFPQTHLLLFHEEGVKLIGLNEPGIDRLGARPIHLVNGSDQVIS